MARSHQQGDIRLGFSQRTNRRFSQLTCIGFFVAFTVSRIGFAQTSQVIIEINSPADTDDFICWTPVPAKARLLGSAGTMPITLRSIGTAAGGAVVFQADTGLRPTRGTFSPQPELQLSLPSDSSWVPFWIAGQRPSVGDKDVNVVAIDSMGAELGRVSLMVRVRKNAEKLQANEIKQFLEALAKVHDLGNGTLHSEYRKHSQAHDEAFSVGIHGGSSGFPLFLAWHRAFLLHLERELQAIDPRVSLPYWRFDQPAPNLFTPDFLGSVSGQPTQPGGFLVNLSTSNPIRNWHMGDGNGPLVRVRDASGAGALPVDRLALIFAVPFNQEYGGVNGALEPNYHNGAHSRIGGWLATASSPRDPLFFLLHANVDRGWSKWQSQFNRFDPTMSSSYSAQGSYPGSTTPGRFPKASYRDDLMWPWNGSGGDQGTPDPLDDWPNFAYSMPASPSNPDLLVNPTPGLTVDYLDTAGTGHGHGVCYDDVSFPAALPGPASGGQV